MMSNAILGDKKLYYCEKHVYGILMLNTNQIKAITYIPEIIHSKITYIASLFHVIGKNHKWTNF